MLWQEPETISLGNLGFSTSLQLSLEQSAPRGIYFLMKSLFFSAILMASIAAVRADDAKPVKDAKAQPQAASCCSAKTDAKVTGKTCSAVTVAKGDECSSCCKDEKPAKQALLTPRALAAK